MSERHTSASGRRRVVSVITCCRNEIRSIEKFLRSLDAQAGEFELEAVIADGASEDGTRAVLDAFASGRSWVRVIENPGKIASTGLNAAIRETRGEILVRMDAHSEYAADYVARSVAVLEERSAAVAGGPMRFANGTYWQNAIGRAYGSHFFSGGSRVYDADYEGPVDSVLYGCWPRRVLEEAGLFDARMVRNQDDELSLRIVERGGRIWQSSSIRSWYYPRRSLWGLAKQLFGYGFWKVYTMRKHRTVVRARHVIPAAAVALAGALGIGALVNRRLRRMWRAGATIYAGAVIVAAGIRAGDEQHWMLLPGIAAAFPVAHAAYGAGTLCGLLKFRSGSIRR